MGGILQALAIPISIVLLYPLAIWLLRAQLPRLIEALSEARQLDESLARLANQIEAVREFQSQVTDLNSRLSLLPEVFAKTSLMQSQIEELQESKANTPPNLTPRQADGWEKINSTWQQSKLRIEQIISELPSGHARRWYNAQERRDYRPIIEKLGGDKHMTEEKAEAFKEMNAIYLSFRNQRMKPSEDVVNRYMGLFKIAMSS